MSTATDRTRNPATAAGFLPWIGAVLVVLIAVAGWWWLSPDPPTRYDLLVDDLVGLEGANGLHREPGQVADAGAVPIGTVANTFYVTHLAAAVDRVDEVTSDRTVSTLRSAWLNGTAHESIIDTVQVPVILATMGRPEPEWEREAIARASELFEEPVTRDTVATVHRLAPMMDALGHPAALGRIEPFEVETGRRTATWRGSRYRWRRIPPTAARSSTSTPISSMRFRGCSPTPTRS